MQKRLTNAASNAIKTFASRRLLRDGVNGGDKSERNREQLNATQVRSSPSRGVHASAVLAAVEGLARGRPVRGRQRERSSDQYEIVARRFFDAS